MLGLMVYFIVEVHCKLRKKETFMEYARRKWGG